MSNETNTPEIPSTPQQAEGVFAQIGELTALQGTRYGDRYTFGENAVTVPSSIAEHFPVLEDDSESASRTVYVTQKLDPATGQPLQEGVVGIVTFIQKEKLDAKQGCSTNINYHVITDNGGETHRLERHVTSTEFGEAQLAKHLARVALPPSREQIEAQLADLKALRSRIDSTTGLENELGLNIVNTQEAQDIVETLHAFNTAR